MGHNVYLATAFDLIERIAVEPVVARYIIYADFDRDAFPLTITMRRDVPDIQLGGPVVKLFADSLYLRQANLDWREYYAQIKKDRPNYSQHATTILLTLLPNVRILKLPRLWEPVGKTEELFEVVCRQAKKCHYAPSLAQVTVFESLRGRYNLEKTVPFLTLPNLRTFADRNSTSIGLPTASKHPFSETLESLSLLRCCIDEVAITNFLKYTPRLRMFEYSHSTRETDDNRDWDMCKFVTAIERVAGNYLEGPSVAVGDHSGSITSRRVSLSGFQRLRQLRLPLCIATCNTIDAASQVATLNENLRDGEIDIFELFVGNTGPPLVSQLSLVSTENDHEKAFKNMFRDFTIRKKYLWPSLEEIRLEGTLDKHSKECGELFAEIKETG